ncbi:expressed unknown protein [Seminavis robusta]|uniref:Uncharacterized protein n=1 Tax=Seminavis robusta TaxID=568900 RepID=A0A9N8DWY5_9STRA|nr:expressed unknown protein [Seminavis robusta]|eukprot:Sro309_g113700.1 n/a (576) ;mRNA; r:8567-10294
MSSQHLQPTPNHGPPSRAKEYASVYAQPFFYGAITRLPFIYFVIHMRFAFGLDWNLVGIFVGCYQAARVVTSIASIFRPGAAHAIGTAVGLAGNLLVIASSTDNQTNIIIGTILVGSSETLSAMQTYVKRQFGGSLNQLEFKLKVQYAAVMVGVTFAFSFGGFIYDHFGINGVATFGAIMSLSELISIVCYWILERRDQQQSQEQSNESRKSQKIRECPSESTNADAHAQSTQASLGSMSSDASDSSSSAARDEEGRPIAKASPSSSSLAAKDTEGDPITEALDSYSESGMGANYLTYALLVTFGMEAITIGYNLAVSPVYITEVFEMSTTVIGGLMAAGAAFGTITTMLIALPKQGRALMEKWLPSPIGFMVAMTGISVAVLVAATPVFPVHVVGLLMLMGFNDLAALLLNELQGSITSSKAYSTIGPLGQVVRRTGNVLTAVSGPIFFGIFPQLPYIVAGSITAIWTIILGLIIRHRSKATHDRLENSPVDKSVSSFYHSTTFSRREIIARQVKMGRFSSGSVQVDVEAAVPVKAGEEEIVFVPENESPSAIFSWDALADPAFSWDALTEFEC